MDLTSYVSSQFNQDFPTQSKFNLKRIIILIAAAVLLIEGGWAIYTLTRPVNKNLAQNPLTSKSLSQENLPKAKLVVAGPESASVGEVFSIDITLDTPVPVDGTDFILKYDPTLLEVQGDKPVMPNKFFPDIPINRSDKNLGKVYYSAVIDDGPGFSGTTSLGKVQFKTLGKGATTISLEFDKGQTTDSNVIGTSNSRDILDSVSNLNINIK